MKKAFARPIINITNKQNQCFAYRARIIHFYTVPYLYELDLQPYLPYKKIPHAVPRVPSQHAQAEIR
ncbi:MAG: hypothetical protein DRN37_11325 [Thermoplasmata archaeon]|nr:MAG: hypothetical protein DRN37_11325 [Thermoplasmata archaeon]